MRHINHCKLIPPEARVKGNCGWCGARLPRTKSGRVHKARRWCSKACSRAYADNHYWRVARTAALARDGFRCQGCKQSPHDHPRPSYPDFDNSEDYRAALHDWERLVKKCRLEVHHVRPLRGKGYTESCLHHLDNLLTLCHSCHKGQHR